MKDSVLLISSALLLFSLIFMSCESGKNSNIRLSTKHIEMMSDENSAVIFAEGTDKWWINDVSADGKRLYALPENIEKEYTGIEGEWFSVEKHGNSKLMVKVSENKSKNDRKIIITLESENYFDYINVLQKGRP